MRVPRPAAGMITTTFMAGCKYTGAEGGVQNNRGSRDKSRLGLIFFTFNLYRDPYRDPHRGRPSAVPVVRSSLRSQSGGPRFRPSHHNRAVRGGDQPDRQLFSVLPTTPPSPLPGRLLPGVYRKHCIEQTLPLRRKLLPSNTVTTRASASKTALV